MRVSATSGVEFPHPGLARAHARGVRCRLVQHQERPILIVLHGRQRETSTYCQPVHPPCPADGRVFSKWTPEHPRSLTTLQAHQACVYQALFSPHQPDLVATCSADGTIRFFDLRSPAYSSTSNAFTSPLSAAVLTVPASPSEELALDWNKYSPFVLASAGIDKAVKIWDCRMLQLGGGSTNAVGGQCVNRLLGHEYAIRKVQWSPHRPDLLASGSYDMTCRM